MCAKSTIYCRLNMEHHMRHYAFSDNSSVNLTIVSNIYSLLLYCLLIFAKNHFHSSRQCSCVSSVGHKFVLEFFVLAKILRPFRILTSGAFMPTLYLGTSMRLLIWLLSSSACLKRVHGRNPNSTC